MKRFFLMSGFFVILSSIFGCSKENTANAPIPVVKSAEEQNRLYHEGIDLIMPYMRLHDVSEKSTKTRAAQRDIRRGIGLLQSVTTYASSNWNAYWFQGKAYQALDEPEPAYGAFKQAFEIQRTNADVAREFMLTCLDLDRAEEAILAAERAIALDPSDAGLHANEALAYVMAGRNSDALKSVEESLRLDPNDKISQNVKRIIQEVMSGKRPQPKKMTDIER